MCEFFENCLYIDSRNYKKKKIVLVQYVIFHFFYVYLQSDTPEIENDADVDEKRARSIEKEVYNHENEELLLDISQNVNSILRHVGGNIKNA